MQRGAEIDTETSDRPRILRDHRFNQYNIKHN